jgi:hypothetical protein
MLCVILGDAGTMTGRAFAAIKPFGRLERSSMSSV